MGPAGAWDDQNAYAGSVLLIDSVFHMWYNGQATSIGVDNNKIGHATSPDGITWIKDPLNPVMTSSEEWDAPLVFSGGTIFDGSNYHMWYNGGKAYETEIGYATSEDGSQWGNYSQPVIRKGPAGSWESHIVWGSSVLFDSTENKYRMWYSGNSTSEFGGQSIGYAESDARLPALWVKSEPMVDTADIDADTLVAEINKDGIIYIVPDGTSLVNDSINKYKLASVEALANTEVNIPLTDFSIGYYVVVAVSDAEFVSPNPFLLRVVDDLLPPVLTLPEGIVESGDSIPATSTKNGMLYLLSAGIPADFFYEYPQYLIASLTVTANDTVKFSTTGLDAPKTYYLYAVDIYGIFSERGTVYVKWPTGVKENATAGLLIYPNPANDLLTIETDKIGRHSIEITSLNGQLLYSTKMKGSTVQIDLSSFQKGVYFITVRSRDYVRTEKIIKF